MRLSRRRSAAALVALLGAALFAPGCAGKQRPAPAMEEAPEQATAAAQGERPARRAADASAAREARLLFERAVANFASQPEQAAGLFERAFDLDPSLGYAAYDAGIAYERVGDLTRARYAYLKALASEPDFEPASLNLTRLRLRTGKSEEAESDLRARIAAHPDRVGLRNQLVEVLLATGRLEGAEQESRRVLKMDEQNVPALVNLATAYYANKRYELARMVLDNARQIDPKDPAVWNRLGFVLIALGNRPEALQAFEKAAAPRADYPEAHVNYGVMLVDAEDYRGAVKELEVAVRYAPTNAVARLNLGNAYRGAKEFDEAQREYERALTLDPHLADAWFDLAVLYLDGDKPSLPPTARLEKSLAYFDKFAAAGGSDPRLAQYRKDAAAALDREKRRLAREEKDRLRKEAEARKKGEPAPGAAAPAKPERAAPPPAQAGATGGDR